MTFGQFETGVYVALSAFIKHIRSTWAGSDWDEEEMWTEFENFVRDRGLKALAQEEDDIPF